MTTNDLRNAELRYQDAFARAEAARAERNRFVREAVAAGWSHAKVAGATGLTRARVGQIAKGGS